MVADTRGRKSTCVRRVPAKLQPQHHSFRGVFRLVGPPDLGGFGKVLRQPGEHPRVAEAFGQSGYVFEWLPITVETVLTALKS